MYARSLILRLLYGKCLYCQSPDHPARSCTKLEFKKGCCYKCGFPHKAWGLEIHGDMRTAACENGLRDLVKGGCWRLYRDETWLRVWMQKQGMRWKDEGEFKAWIQGMEVEGEILNGVRLILEAWREITG